MQSIKKKKKPNTLLVFNVTSLEPYYFYTVNSFSSRITNGPFCRLVFRYSRKSHSIITFYLIKLYRIEDLLTLHDACGEQRCFTRTAIQSAMKKVSLKLLVNLIPSYFFFQPQRIRWIKFHTKTEQNRIHVQNIFAIKRTYFTCDILKKKRIVVANKFCPNEIIAVYRSDFQIAHFSTIFVAFRNFVILFNKTMQYRGDDDG